MYSKESEQAVFVLYPHTRSKQHTATEPSHDARNWFVSKLWWLDKQLRVFFCIEPHFQMLYMFAREGCHDRCWLWTPKLLHQNTMDEGCISSASHIRSFHSNGSESKETSVGGTRWAIGPLNVWNWFSHNLETSKALFSKQFLLDPDYSSKGQPFTFIYMYVCVVYPVWHPIPFNCRCDELEVKMHMSDGSVFASHTCRCPNFTTLVARTAAVMTPSMCYVRICMAKKQLWQASGSS